MKKNFMLLALIAAFSLTASAQSKWFFSVETGAALGGPKSSLMNKMRSTGFADKESNMTLLIGWENDYPIGDNYPPLVARFGKKIKENKSLYVLAGAPLIGKVEGFREYGFDNWFLVGGSYGLNIKVNYQLYQLAAGYQFSNSKDRLRFSIGPSVYAYHYTNTHQSVESSETKILPGANLGFRVPLGKEKKLVGVDFIANANMLPSVKMNEMSGVVEIDGKKESYRFQPDRVNLMNANIGFALSFRR